MINKDLGGGGEEFLDFVGAQLLWGGDIEFLQSPTLGKTLNITFR